MTAFIVIRNCLFLYNLFIGNIKFNKNVEKMIILLKYVSKSTY